MISSRASWNLRSILGIDEDAQTISLDATIRFQWKDTRVRTMKGEKLRAKFTIGTSRASLTSFLRNEVKKGLRAV